MPNTTKLISCRLTESDFEALRSHAESFELNQSDYIRHLIRIPVDGDGLATGEKLISLDTKTFGRIYSELVRWGRHYNQAVRALNTIALFIRRGSPPEYGTFGQMLSEAEEKLEEVEQGRQVIEYVLTDIAGSTIVSGD